MSDLSSNVAKAFEIANRQRAALELIASGDDNALGSWAIKNLRHDHHILVTFLRGYRPSYREASEYRGALVYIQREIARQCLMPSNS